jgi:hypothetical protein
MAVGVKAGIEVGVEAGMATAEEIRRTGLIVRVFGRFKVKAGCVVAAGASVCDRREV